MRELAMTVVIGLLAVACTQSARDDQEALDGSVARSSQFLAACDDTCAEPLSCVCGVCTIACTSDEPCAQYSSNASCVLPSTQDECESAERSCDVPCTHDTICERLGADLVCLVGRCRHQVDDGSQDAGPTDAAPQNEGLAECAARAPIAGLCVLSSDGPGAVGNEGAPLQGTIAAIGDSEARPECFGSDNFGAAIPVAAHPEEQPVIPQATSWWRVDAGTVVYSIGIAAPGLDALGVMVGDSIVIRHAVSWAGWDWPHGNAEVEIAGRGHVLIAINDSSLLDVSDGPAHCERPGPCGGEEWSMRIDVDGAQINVPPFESVRLGSSLFTNAGALTHRPEYIEPNDATESTAGCKGEPRTTFVATRVDTL